MTMDTDSPEPSETPDQVIARLRLENAGLRRALEGERFAADLRMALTRAGAAGVIAGPMSHSRLLEMIVETAAQVISAEAASLFLIDQATQELIFEVALGQKADEVKRFRVPLGHGIAGLVAVTGQPMAVSDAQSDPRRASDIGQSIGYVPRNILCVPLYFDDQVIGVLELLDKIGAPSFSPADTTALGLFANLAAVAIEQSRLHRNLGALLGDAIRSLIPPTDQDGAALEQDARRFAESLAEDDSDFQSALELAGLVQETVSRGERERGLCLAILRAFGTYARSGPDSLTSLDWL
jgi:GAF domain-containing protein